MGEQFDGRVLVTTNAKAQAVRSLLDYWTMKTDLLKKRVNPALFADKEVQQKTKNFLLKNTKLSDSPFWQSLSATGQEVAMKCFTMQEVPKPKKEMLSRSRLRAVIYVCLSGIATVRNMKSGANKKFGAGEIFGSLDLFNKVLVEGQEMTDDHPEDKGPPESLIEFGEGTFMRMELNDLYNTVLKPDEQEAELAEAQKEQEQAVKISGIAWEKMTDDDKFYVRVYQRTKELVNPRFFQFLDSYRMIPKNAQMPAYKYYNEGFQGREVYLDERDHTWVFVIIDGSVKMELASTKLSAVEHTLTCVRKTDDTTMHVKTKSMPLMLLSPGSVMCIQSECFTLADPKDTLDPDSYEALCSPTLKTPLSPLSSAPPSAGNRGGKGVLSKFRSNFPHNKLPHSGAATPNMARRGSEASIDTFATGRTAATMNTFNTIGSAIDTKVHKKSDHFVPCSTPPDSKDAKYHIKLVFEAHTTFLAVPYANFERILGDGKLVLPKIAKEIKWYLSSPNDLIKERINRLLPWIQGNIDFSKKEIVPKIVKSLGFLLNEPGPKTDDKANTLGSFAPSSGQQDGGSFLFTPMTPHLSARAPSAFDDASNFSVKSNNSGRSTPKVTAARRGSEQDATMSSMLAQLRNDSTAKNKTRGSMFMTQDMDASSSLLEEDGDDSDSDISMSDFKQPQPAAAVTTKTAKSAKQKIRGQFSDSFKDEDQPKTASVIEYGSIVKDFSKELSESGGLDTRVNAMSVNVVDGDQASFVTSYASEGKDEVDLQSLEREIIH